MNMKQLKIQNSITERNFITEKYLADVSPIPMIDAQKEVELAQRIKNGDKQAENELIISNLRFVISCAKQYQNRGLPFEDLIAEGNIGLIKAAKRFDETRGFKFISYAVSWVRQSILDSIHKNGRTIRIPQNRLAQQLKIRDLVSKKMQEMSGNICVDEICKELNIDIVTFNQLTSNNNVFSYDKFVSQDSEQTYLDLLSDEKNNIDLSIDDDSRRKQISEAFSCLTEIEVYVIQNSFGMNKERREYSTTELGEILDFTSERIRQIKAKAMKKLKINLSRKYKLDNIFF